MGGFKQRYFRSRRFNRNRGSHQNQNQNNGENAYANRETTPKKSLKEDEVGITEFVSKMDGFTGVLKARFSDFHVNEIDADGNEIRLTNQDLPTPPDDSIGMVKLEKNKKDLETVLTQDVWLKIDALLRSTDMGASVDIDVTNLEKGRRTQVHKVLKEIYGTKLISTTDTVDNKKFISCSKANGNHAEKRTRWLWPEKYVYFTVHKENTDTVQAASDIASVLRMPPSYVNYAGTKDKRAKTTQRFCVKKREPEHILKSCRRISYIKVGNFQLKDKVLKLGDLKGNRFRIALRHVDGDNEKIIKSLENMKQNGFINYYGLQRFGNCSTVPTYQIGIALLKSDYKEAAELILKPRDGDLYFIKQARETWWKNRNSAEAAAMINNTKFIEKKLLDGLAKFGENDYANALKRIPRNMLLLYTHSFQSFIWNQIASLRIAKYGLRIIPGDLILRDENEINTEEIIEEEMMVDEDQQNEYGEKASEEQMEKSDEKPEDKVSIFKQKVRPLTQADIKSKRYGIFDIILPLPGYDVTYPDNEVGKWYDALLAEHGLTSEKALLLDLILPASSYATMALREILKADTSSMNQARIEAEMKLKSEETGKRKCLDENDSTENKKLKVAK